MPSNSLINFEKNLIQDVERLYSSHSVLNHVGRGRRGLGHITRSGIFMLCAAWEVYHEELIKESVRIIADKTPLPKDLPKPVRSKLILHYDSFQDRSKLLSIAGDGWKSTFINCCDNVVDKMNTPNVQNLNKLYKDFMGIEIISTFWSIEDEKIDKFISIRGDIAHNGSSAQYVTIKNLESYISTVKYTVIENDNAVLDYIKDNFNNGKSPWYRKSI
jgi:hypothetical protein